MRFFAGLLDRLLLVAAVVAGGLVPGFLAQYRQRLGGRLDQARLDLAPWQAIANRYHHGSLDELIRYHLASTDLTFNAEGTVISALRDSVTRLEAAFAALQGNVFQQFAHVLLHGDVGLAHATLASWVPTFALSGDGLLFALALAAVLWGMGWLLWWLLGLAIRALRR